MALIVRPLADAIVAGTRRRKHLDGEQKLHHALAAGRGAYVQVARGQLQVNGITLEAGDALQVSDEAQLTLENGNDAEVLVFDLPL